ncbi:MAG: hypothetical protein ACLTSZ_08685 [Lachnospiraceae bacterium]
MTVPSGRDDDDEPAPGDYCGRFIQSLSSRQYQRPYTEASKMTNDVTVRSAAFSSEQ